MNKVDYIVLVAASFFSIFIIWKRKEKKKENIFEEEILNLKNAVEFAIDKIGE